jgi:hypothetical protein
MVLPVVPEPNPAVAGFAAPKRVLPPALALLLPKPPVVFAAPPKGDDVAAAFPPKPPDVAPPPKRPPPVAGAGAPKAGLLAAPKGDDVAAALLDAPKPRSHSSQYVRKGKCDDDEEDRIAKREAVSRSQARQGIEHTAKTTSSSRSSKQTRASSRLLTKSSAR